MGENGRRKGGSGNGQSDWFGLHLHLTHRLRPQSDTLSRVLQVVRLQRRGLRVKGVGLEEIPFLFSTFALLKEVAGGLGSQRFQRQRHSYCPRTHSHTEPDASVAPPVQLMN